MYHHLSLIFSLSIKKSKKTVTEEQARIPIHVLTSLWSIKLHYKFIESSQDCNLMLTLNELDHVRVHPPLARTGG